MPVFFFYFSCVALEALGDADDLLQLGVGYLYL